MKPRRSPKIDARFRLPLRLVALGFAFLLYKFYSVEHFDAGLAIGVGIFLLLDVLVTKLTTRPAERSERVGSGATMLGMALVALGLFLNLR